MLKTKDSSCKNVPDDYMIRYMIITLLQDQVMLLIQHVPPVCLLCNRQ